MNRFVAALVVASTLIGGDVFAQAPYPDRSVRIIVCVQRRTATRKRRTSGRIDARVDVPSQCAGN
jgi:hypothetical protein